MLLRFSLNAALTFACYCRFRGVAHEQCKNCKIQPTYNFYVQAICPNDSSTMSGPGSFQTLCGIFTAPYTESFENGGNIATCWNESGTQSAIYTPAGGVPR